MRVTIMMTRAPLTAGLALSAWPAWAETIDCLMDTGEALTFTINDSQFAPPLDPNDPPRQARTQVRHGERVFPATPFRIGDTRGFEATFADGSGTVFVVQADGTAVLSYASGTGRLAGHCTSDKGAQ